MGPYASMVNGIVLGLADDVDNSAAAFVVDAFLGGSLAVDNSLTE
jgi:hypothetical protein